MLVGPVIAIGLLLRLPFIAGTGEKSWKRRPVAVLGVILIVLIVTTLAAARPRTCRGRRTWTRGARCRRRSRT